MYSLNGAQRIYVYKDKRIIKSSASGATNVTEVKWLTEKMVEYSADWKECGWGYVVGISEMEPVNAEVSEKLVELHKAVEQAGCKAIAFVDPNAFMLAMQAKKHQRVSKVSCKEKHFKTDEDAIAWLEKILNES